MKAFRILAVACFCCLTTSAIARTLVGPGPDDGGGGNELRITREHGQVHLIEHIVPDTNRTVVERYRSLLGSDDWQITLLLYPRVQAVYLSTSWDELLTKSRLVGRVSFRASRATASEPRYQQDFGYSGIQWAREPKRLLDFYRAHRAAFHPET